MQVTEEMMDASSEKRNEAMEALSEGKIDQKWSDTNMSKIIMITMSVK